MEERIIRKRRGSFTPPAADAVSSLSSIPALLRNQRRWVGFRLIPRPAAKKPKKIPFIADDPAQKADISTPSTWRDFDAVLRGLRGEMFTAAAFAIAGNGIVGIDLDGGRWVSEEGELTAEAMAVVERCASYAEMSISGRGLHILLRGKLPPGRRINRTMDVETYDDARFFITTGRRIDGSADDVVENSSAVEWFHDRYLGIGTRQATEKTETTERAEKMSSVVSGVSVLSVGVEQVEDIIRRTLPKKVGERSGCLFDLGRGLKHNCGMADASFPTLKPLVRQWHTLALPRIGTKAFDETWSDFVRQWKSANVPLGVDVERWALERAKATFPPAAADYDLPTVRLLLGMCWHLSTLNTGGRFFLSSHKAGGLLSVTHDRVLSWLRMFCADGILEITEAGNERRATRYRYLAKDRPQTEK